MFWIFFFIILPFIVQLSQKHLSPLEIRTIIKIGIQKEFLWTVRGLCRKPLFRLWSFVWGLWLCCGQTHAFAEHLCQLRAPGACKGFLCLQRGLPHTHSLWGSKRCTRDSRGRVPHCSHEKLLVKGSSQSRAFQSQALILAARTVGDPCTS